MKKTYKDTFFTHSNVRIGRNGRAIKITKLRSMPKGSHRTYEKRLGNMKFVGETSSDGKGMVGRFLRKSKLDDLPQIGNVLKRELALVGMRPIPRQEYVRLQEDIKKMYDKFGPGLFGIKYSLPKHQRTEENIFRQARIFYDDVKRGRTLRWGLKILKNLYKN